MARTAAQRTAARQRAITRAFDGLAQRRDRGELTATQYMAKYRSLLRIADRYDRYGV